MSRWKKLDLEKQLAPLNAAVYAIYVDAICVYIGSAVDLAARLRGHEKLKAARSLGAVTVKYRLESRDLIRSAETALIKRLRPRLNTVHCCLPRDPDSRVIELMSADCDGNREVVAQRLGIGQPTLDAWLAKTRMDRMMPVTALPGWVLATGSTRLLEWAAASVGYRLATEEDLRDAAIGRKLRELTGAVLAEVAA